MLVPVVLSGGNGSRLWPISREAYPKPFIRFNNDPHSLIQKTYHRAINLPNIEKIITVTNFEYYYQSLKELNGLNAFNKLIEFNFILEPCSRNTAAAIAFSALFVNELIDPEAVLLILPADHLILNQDKFKISVEKAYQLAKKDFLTTFGIIPHKPETAYGYIQYNKSIELDFGFKKFDLDKQSFYKLENISIDYALMEKAKNLAVIPADFGWSDLGSWGALNILLKPGENDNRISGNTCLQETYNTTIYSQNSPGRLITTIGVENLTIIDSNDALLICKNTHIQKVKQLVEKLKSNGQETYRYHQTVYRPWGHYTILDQGYNYKLKRLIVHAGASLSLQMHQYRCEYWVVVVGIATVENDHKKFILKEQESTYIPLGCKHCLSNCHDEDLVVIELQIGNYLGEDDIIRFRDNYDREIKRTSENEINI
ncbi:hypothetical protein FQR65_LT05188 [Abscondita terminalis]|nr:hypothetical protein FQR65_LT05188 [Abscondita terminalis]